MFENKFVVHKEFTCYYSPVLKAVFESKLIEGQKQTYRLTDSNGATVQLWCNNHIIKRSRSTLVNSTQRTARPSLASELFTPGLQMWPQESSGKSRRNLTFTKLSRTAVLSVSFFVHRYADFLQNDWYADNPKDMLVEIVTFFATNTNSRTKLLD